MAVVGIFHFDPIGQVVVNDICVNGSASNTYGIESGCEDGVWVATNNGLFYLNPDYGKYFNPQTQIAAVKFNLPNSDTLTKVQMCSGDSVSLVFNYGYIGSNSIQWQKDGKDLVGKTASGITVKDSGDYAAVLYTPCENIHVQTNHLKVKVITAPVFTFNYPDTLNQCNNNPITLQVTNNTLYQYRWYTNGSLNGNTTQSNTVTKSGKYKVELSSCNSNWVASKELQVNLVTLPLPVLSLDKNLYCAEDTAKLSVNLTTDPSYTINWYRDGNLLPADKNLTTIKDTKNGSYTAVLSSNISNCTQASAPLQLFFTPSPTFTFNYPDELQYCAGTPVTLSALGSATYQYRWYKDGVLNGITTSSINVTQTGKYKVEVSACAGSWASSKEVLVNFVQLKIPVITADKPAYCIGDNASYKVSVPTASTYTINWYRDNVFLAGNTNSSTIFTNTPGDYKVTVVNNTTNSDGSICSQTSAVQSLSFNPPLTISIEKVIKTNLCDGQTIGLIIHHNSGTVKWSTGETVDQINVNTSGNYKVRVTSPAGCIADTSIDVAFLANPIFTVKDTSICVYKRQPVTLAGPVGYVGYEWNGQPGSQT